jgi:hypothetical protein
MDKPARSPLVRSFERHLRSTNRSESTVATYLIGLRQAKVVAALGVVLQHLVEEVAGGQPLALESALHVGDGEQHRVDAPGVDLGSQLLDRQCPWHGPPFPMALFVVESRGGYTLRKQG